MYTVIFMRGAYWDSSVNEDPPFDRVLRESEGRKKGNVARALYLSGRRSLISRRRIDGFN